jgi:hypothetical protein
MTFIKPISFASFHSDSRRKIDHDKIPEGVNSDSKGLGSSISDNSGRKVLRLALPSCKISTIQSALPTHMEIGVDKIHGEKRREHFKTVAKV